VVWNRFNALVEILPPCGGADEPNQWEVRQSVYLLDPDEVFPVMTEDEHLEKMGVILKGFVDGFSSPEPVVLILPVGLNLRRSNEFLSQSLADMVATLRREYERQFGAVEISVAKGKSSEAAKTPARLKRLAAKRLWESLSEGNPRKGGIRQWEEAAKLCAEVDITLYSNTSESSWHRARRQAVRETVARMETLYGLNGEKWMAPCKARIEEAQRRQNAPS